MAGCILNNFGGLGTGWDKVLLLADDNEDGTEPDDDGDSERDDGAGDNEWWACNSGPCTELFCSLLAGRIINNSTKTLKT